MKPGTISVVVKSSDEPVFSSNLCINSGSSAGKESACNAGERKKEREREKERKWSCSVMSDSLQPHGLKPTRLLHPWDSPGKNTGVGYHFLLQGIFPTQGSNPGLLHYRQTLYPLSHQDPGSIPRSGRFTREGIGHPMQYSTQGSNPGLLHYRQTLYPLSHQDPGSIPRSGRFTREGIGHPMQYSWASLVAQLVKNLPTMPETWVPYLGWEDPLEKETATHSSILTWRISWTIQSQRVRHNWMTFPHSVSAWLCVLACRV